MYYLIAFYHRIVELWYHAENFPNAPRTCLTADPGVLAIPGRSLTFMEIDHEIISMAIIFPSANSRRAVVSYKQKCVHEVLVNRLVKLVQEKVCLDELTVLTWP